MCRRRRLFAPGCVLGVVAMGSACGNSSTPAAPSTHVQPVQPSTSTSLEAEDCLSYDSTTVTNVPEQDGISIRTSIPGGQALGVLAATATDATNDVALMQRYSTICYIGRSNNLPNRLAYIMEYWKNPTGVISTIAPEDCQNYTPSALKIENGPAGWTVTDGVNPLLLFATPNDANLGLSVARQHTEECFIGRGPALQYVTDYFK